MENVSAGREYVSAGRERILEYQKLQRRATIDFIEYQDSNGAGRDFGTRLWRLGLAEVRDRWECQLSIKVGIDGDCNLVKISSNDGDAIGDIV